MEASPLMLPDPANELLRGLSVVVLHYNRPLCAELAALALRADLEHEDLPHELILADDGSVEQLVPRLFELPFDRIVLRTASDDGGRPRYEVFPVKAAPRWPTDRDPSTAAASLAADLRERALAADHSVYDTIGTALQAAQFDTVLFIEDDFWIMPQGFCDQQKDHTQGLLSVPSREASDRPLSAAVALLEDVPEVRFVELARGFDNPRYHCAAETARRFGAVELRAKVQQAHPRYYTCDWPYMMRTVQARSVPLPTGLPCWEGEQLLELARRQLFGPGSWAYNPQRSYFVHVDAFSWREMCQRRGGDNRFQWMHAATSCSPLLTLARIPNFNARLLQGFVDGTIVNDPIRFLSTSPARYVHDQLYQVLAP